MKDKDIYEDGSMNLSWPGANAGARLLMHVFGQRGPHVEPLAGDQHDQPMAQRDQETLIDSGCCLDSLRCLFIEWGCSGSWCWERLFPRMELEPQKVLACVSVVECGCWTCF